MAQRDYIRRGQSAFSRRQKGNLRQKQNNLPFVSPTIGAVSMVVLVTLISSLYCIIHHKKEELPTLQDNKVISDNLPPKPEKRWRYIKELENHQPSVRTYTESFADRQIKNPNQLKNEQRYLLTQMEADIRKKPMKLNGALWNKQILEQHQGQTHIQQQQQQWIQTHPVHQLKAQPYQQIQQHTIQPQPVQQQLKIPLQKQTAKPYKDLLQISTHNTLQQPKIQQSTSVKKETEAIKQQIEKKKYEYCWIVQCGSFKGGEQAEIVHAQLTFEGFESRITSNSGWNRVMIGPLKGKNNADSIIARLKMVGYTNCIRLASRG